MIDVQSDKEVVECLWTSDRFLYPIFIRDVVCFVIGRGAMFFGMCLENLNLNKMIKLPAERKA